MWSEEINKKILEGESRQAPGCTDEAWDNMSTLLDKHLPEKRFKRRFLLLLLIPVFLGGGAAVYFLQNKDRSTATSSMVEKIPVAGQQQDPGSSTGEQQVSPASTQRPGQPADGKNLLPEKTVNTEELPTSKDFKQQDQQTRKVSIAAESIAGRTDNITTNQPQLRSKKSANINSQSEKGKADLIAIPGTERKNQAQQAESIQSEQLKNNPVLPAINDAKEDQHPVLKNEKIAEPGELISPAATKSMAKSRRSFGDRFSLTFSAGPDISGVGIDNPGKFTLQYGLGASYSFSKNFSIRTGFYAGDKRYSADPEDYTPPYTINNLEKIDADCFIYEIPLTLAYSFAQAKKHSWFAAAGFSSYIMKKETYGYHYKNTWGQPQYYDRTYRNENKHLFSVVNLSGGYQHHLSDRFSFWAEPYVKIPVSGIGVGKVKLANSGVLFTVNYKPFFKK